MGKRKVLNESQLKELKLPQEGEMFGRVIKMMGRKASLLEEYMKTHGKYPSCNVETS